MDLSPKKKYRFLRIHHQVETRKEMKDPHHQPPADRKQKKKSKTCPGSGVTKPDFPAKTALKELLSQAVGGGAGRWGGGG